MTENARGPIAVRPHFFTGAALLAAGAILGVVTAYDAALLPSDAHIIGFLGGLTLFAQGIAYWYLPSFAKRSVVLDGMASYAGPILFPAALVGAIFEIDGLRGPGLILGLAIFPVVVFASAIFGPRWRSGIPFWRAEGPHRRGDVAAMLVLASAFLWMLGAAIGALRAPPTIVVAWPTALGLFSLGALAHLVPRSRSKPALWIPFLALTLVGEIGALLATLARVGIAGKYTRAGYALLAAFALAALAIAPPGRGKRVGPRGREAAPFLWASVGALLLGVVAATAWPSVTLARAVTAYYAFLAAAGLALAGLALLTMPVLFNQRPAGRLVFPTLIVFLCAATLLAASLITPLPRWPAALLLAGTLVLWLATMAPLRTPRRACP